MLRSKIAIGLFIAGLLLGGFFGYLINVTPYQQRIDELQRRVSDLQAQLEGQSLQIKQLNQKNLELRRLLLKEIAVANITRRSEVTWSATENRLTASFDLVLYNGMMTNIHIPRVRMQVLNATAKDGTFFPGEAFPPETLNTEAIITANGTALFTLDVDIEIKKVLREIWLQWAFYINEIDAEFQFTLVLSL